MSSSRPICKASLDCAAFYTIGPSVQKRRACLQIKPDRSTLRKLFPSAFQGLVPVQPSGSQVTYIFVRQLFRSVGLIESDALRQASQEGLMVGPPTSRGSISGGSITGGFPPQSGPSETDGDTDNFTDDFGEYDEWDYQEMIANVGKHLKKFVMQPLLIGAAAAYGMSIGYAAFDMTAALFRRRPVQPVK